MKTQLLVTVKVVSARLLEQLYYTRGELNSTPDRLSASEKVVGYLVNGAGVLVQDGQTQNLRLLWPYRYAIGLGLGTVANDAHTAHFKTLPQLFQS